MGTLIVAAVYILRKGELQMLPLRPFFMLGLALSLILTSCSTSAPASLPVSASSATSPEPTFTPAPVGPGVPALQFLNDKSELLVISVATGQDLDSFTPIPIHDFYSYAFAPDGHLLALVANNKLYMIDLPAWKTRQYDLNLYGWMSSIVYNSDGSRLAIASGEPESQVWIIDPQSGKIMANRKSDFSIRRLQFTTDGKALMAYGPQIASAGVAAKAGISVGSPKAAIYSISDLAPLWSIELDGIQDGTFPKEPEAPITDNIYLPGSAWHYEPGTIFSPKGDLLYLVHADEDKLTTVDFASQKVRTIDIQAKTSWLDRLMALTAVTVHAKGMDGTVKRVWISQDGKLLFVGGTTEKVTMPTSTSKLEIIDTAIGLQVVATDDGTLVDRIDEEVTPTGLSVDGRYLFLTKWKHKEDNTGPMTDIYDITSMDIFKQLDNVSLTPTRRIDGRPVLVSTEFSGSNGDNVCNLAIVDTGNWTILNQWKRDCVIWLDIQ
jgi:WD40 repeat protein